MYDIKPLEEEWKRYQKKKKRPYIIIFFILVLLGAGIAVLYYTKDINVHRLPTDRNITAKLKQKAVVFVEDGPLKQLQTDQESAEEEQAEISDEIVENLPLPSGKTVRKKPKVKMNIITTEMPTVKKRTVKKTEAQTVPHKKVHLKITETSAANAYKEVARRFRETKDPDDSLFLARIYYNKRQYKKAEYWALQTNMVDSNIEEGVLIFVKAKAKRGHRNEAIRILSKYIKQTNSRAAKILLQKIKKGKV